MKITAALVLGLAPRAKPAVVKAIVDRAPLVLPKYGITTPLRMAHFFAQLLHESGGFTILEENLNYTAVRLTEVWPSRFRTIGAATPYARNPVGLANNVYANRMGNGTSASGDGWKYRGRSLAQHTGKDGYEQIGKITGLPLVENPDLVNDPRYMLECACAFWQWKALAPLADRDDVEGITKRWNGGLNGIADRRAWLEKTKRVFSKPLDPVVPDVEPAPAPVPVEPAPAPVPAPTPQPGFWRKLWDDFIRGLKP